MLNIRTYNTYFADMVTRVTLIKQAIRVSNEAQLKKKIAEMVQFPILVYTIPSADQEARDDDSILDHNTGILFVLTKLADSDRSDETELTALEQTQTAMADIKNLMLYDKNNCDSPYHQTMQRLQTNSLHTDPEYNYLGCDGWSLSFKLATLGM